MYIVNTIKRVILYGNEFIHHKEQNNSSIPIYPLQGVFYPKNLSCTPKIDMSLYMLLYIGGTKIGKKT